MHALEHVTTGVNSAADGQTANVNSALGLFENCASRSQEAFIVRGRAIAGIADGTPCSS